MNNFSRLLDFMTPALIGYILNFNESQYETLKIRREVALTEKQNEVYQTISRLIEKQRKRLYESGANDLTNIDDLMFTLFNQDTMLAYKMRQSCSGMMYAYKNSGDPLLDYFGNRIGFIYPQLLGNESFRLNQIPDFIDPNHKLLLDVVSRDSIFSLFKDNGERCFVTKTSLYDKKGLEVAYISGSIVSVFDSIISVCFENCIFKLDISEHNLMTEIKKALQFLRRLASKKAITFSIFTGISGVGFDGFDEIELDGLILRNISHRDLTWRISRTTHSVIANHPKVKSYGLSAETFYKLKSKSKIKSTKHRISPYMDDRVLFADADLKISNFYMAMLFAKDEYSNLVTTFQETGYYFKNCHYGVGEYKHTRLIPIYEDEVDEIKTWYSNFQNCTSKSITNAVNNIKSAALTQCSVSDSIMNGFYAWESMFTSSQNTTDAVTYGISKCSEVDITRLEDLYDRFRSSKAHGEDFKPREDEQLDNIRAEVLNIAIRCLKTIFDDQKLLILTPSNRVNEFRKRQQ